MSARRGATIPRNSMSDWIRIASDWLEPLYKRMRQRLLESGYIQVDDAGRSPEMAQPRAIASG